MLSGALGAGIRTAAAVNGAFQVGAGVQQAVDGDLWNAFGNVVFGALGVAAIKVPSVKSPSGLGATTEEVVVANRTVISGEAEFIGPVRTAAQEAAAWQGSPRFPGVDRWRDITLKQGTIVYAGEPGLSGFMTTQSAIRRVDGNATALFEGLQVPPRNGLYRNGVTAYEVLEDIPAAMAQALANRKVSPGGLPQLYVPSVNQVTRTHGPVPSMEALINEGKLRPIVTYPLTNRQAP